MTARRLAAILAPREGHRTRFGTRQRWENHKFLRGGETMSHPERTYL
jgi:hypothetical protein